MFWSCQFGLKLVHMNQKYVFLISSLLESIKCFFGGGGSNRVGRVTGNKYSFFFALHTLTLLSPTNAKNKGRRHKIILNTYWQSLSLYSGSLSITQFVRDNSSVGHFPAFITWKKERYFHHHSIAVLLKFVGPVRQSDIFYVCPTKNVRVPDLMSEWKYNNIHLVDEKRQNTSDHKGQQL